VPLPEAPNGGPAAEVQRNQRKLGEKSRLGVPTGMPIGKDTYSRLPLAAMNSCGDPSLRAQPHFKFCTGWPPATSARTRVRFKTKFCLQALMSLDSTPFRRAL
jgi:hypothetical protein